MARYLNVSDKKDLLKLVSFYANLGEMIDTWVKYKKPAIWLKYLRTAKTFIDKVCLAMTDGLDDKAARSILSYSSNLEVAIVSTENYKLKYQEMLEMESVAPIKTEDLYDLMDDICGEHCQKNCMKKGEEVDKCVARKFMINYDIPVAREVVSDGDCPYRLQ